MKPAKAKLLSYNFKVFLMCMLLLQSKFGSNTHNIKI